MVRFIYCFKKKFPLISNFSGETEGGSADPTSRTKSIDSVGSDANLLDAIEKCEANYKVKDPPAVSTPKPQHEAEEATVALHPTPPQQQPEEEGFEDDFTEHLKEVEAVVEKQAEEEERLVDNTVLELAQDCANRFNEQDFDKKERNC